jgi:hypothetical protein
MSKRSRATCWPHRAEGFHQGFRYQIESLKMDPLGVARWEYESKVVAITDERRERFVAVPSRGMLRFGRLLDDAIASARADAERQIDALLASQPA